MHYDYRRARKKWPFLLITLVMCLFVVFGSVKPEKIGDRLQIAIPVIGAVCAWQIRDLGEFSIRYVTTFASVHLVKNTLGSAPLNMRPNGYDQGMPSGHTMAATFGASYIVRECSDKIPYIGTVAIIGAAFTAVSRVDAEKHNPWQVLAGALFGIIGERAFRKTTRRWRFNRRKQK